MKEGSYPRPKHGLPLPLSKEKIREPRIVCVVPYHLTGTPKGYGHYAEDKLATIRATIAAHEHFDPGVPYDLVLVDNGSPDRAAAAGVMQGRRGYRRANEGYGFGAWKHAWEVFGDQYTHYLFTEDDIAPAKDGWLKEILGRFEARPDVGAIGSFLEGRSEQESMSPLMWELLEHTSHDMIYNLDGAFTFTSAAVLRQVDAIGGLTVFPCEPEGPYWPTVNEVAFVSRILELGYTVDSFHDGEHFVVHGSEVFTGDVSEDPALPPAPLINLNGCRRIPRVREIFSFLDAEGGIMPS